MIKLVINANVLAVKRLSLIFLPSKLTHQISYHLSSHLFPSRSHFQKIKNLHKKPVFGFHTQNPIFFSFLNCLMFFLFKYTILSKLLTLKNPDIVLAVQKNKFLYIQNQHKIYIKNLKKKFKNIDRKVLKKFVLNLIHWAYIRNFFNLYTNRLSAYHLSKFE